MFLIISTWFAAYPSAAHPDLDAQEEALTKQIQVHGASADLLCQRADVFRRHGEFDNALADLAAAKKLTNAMPQVLLDEALVHFEAGNTYEAFAEAQTFLTNNPTNLQAIIIRARCYSRLNQPAKAIKDYTQAIQHCPRPGPDLYLARAHEQAALGQYAEAAKGLDEAIAQSDEVSPLVLTAIQYNRKANEFAVAISRVNLLIKRYPVKEPWLVLRAEIEEQAGETKKAESDFQAALDGIEKYSADRKSLDMTKALTERANNGINRLSRNHQLPASH